MRTAGARRPTVHWLGLAGACLFLLGDACAEQWKQVIFRDDFDGPGSVPDSGAWIVNHPSSWWWTQGRTFFPSPVYHPGAPFPYLDGGKCVIQHHRYNPYDLGTPKTTFLGGEVRTVMEFDPGRPYRFEARVKCGAYPGGLVTSFFTYGYDGANSDEIDFEFLSKQTNDGGRWPTGDPVLTNPWDETRQNPRYATVTDLDLTAWNTFRIHWRPHDRVEWTWVNPLGGETLLRTESNQWVPDEPMALYFNFWAPSPTWPDAYDAALQPAAAAGQDEVVRYEIDYVEVTIPAPELAVGTSGGDCQLRWPTNIGAGFLLEGATDLVTVAEWTAVTNPVSVLDGQYKVTVPLDDGDAFFRLHR